MPRQISQPQTKEAKRLERVRKTKGFDTLKAFHRTLEEAGFSFPYQTLRNWHRGDRDPTASYYNALHKVFGAKLEYLYSGVGAVFQETPDNISDATEPVFVAGGKIAWDLFMKLLARLVLSCPDGKKPETEKSLGPLAHHLQRRVLDTYHTLNPGGFENQIRQNDHIEAMLHAMALAVPDPGQGVPIKKLLKNLGRKS